MDKNSDIFRAPTISSNERAIEKVEVKIDRLLEINKSQVDDIKDVKEEVSEIKEAMSSLSNQFSIHSFEDATRFREWENKWTKEVEPVLKFTNERIALGGWVKGNQKLIIFFILAMLSVFGIVKSDQLIEFAKTGSMEHVEKKETPEPVEKSTTQFGSELERALTIPEEKKL